jgi:hypothetical protein
VFFEKYFLNKTTLLRKDEEEKKRKEIQFWIILLFCFIFSIFLIINVWSIDFLLMNFFYYIAYTLTF